MNNPPHSTQEADKVTISQGGHSFVEGSQVIFAELFSLLSSYFPVTTKTTKLPKVRFSNSQRQEANVLTTETGPKEENKLKQKETFKTRYLGMSGDSFSWELR